MLRQRCDAGYAGGFPSYSFATNPVTRPAIYNASAPPGARWGELLADSQVPRLYHSSLMLLKTGEVSFPAAPQLSPGGC